MARHGWILCALCSIGLASCGGDDEKQAQETVRQFVAATNSRDTKKFCDELVTQQFLEQSTGTTGDNARDACHRQLRSLKGVKVRLERVAGTTVDRDRARVRTVLSVEGQRQDQIFRLKKEDGDWKLAGGGGE